MHYDGRHNTRPALEDMMSDKMMDNELKSKVLKLAVQICQMHGSIAGDRFCQDWSDDEVVLDSLTEAERDLLLKQYEDYNSGGADYIEGYFPYDEMYLSYVIARALELMVNELQPAATE